MTDDEKFDVDAVARRDGDELGGIEYRCTSCHEIFWSPYASQVIEFCPKCGEAEIEVTGLSLVGSLQTSQAYQSWARAKYAAEQAGGDE